MTRRWVAVAGVCLVALMALAFTATSAAAHAAYKYSNPDDESTVEQPPTEIWAEYTEPPTDASYLQVYDPCGVQVDHGDSRAAPAQNRVYISMSSNRAGTYQVDWFVDSAVDAHSTRGTFTFTVTDGEPCPGSETVEEDKERREQAAPRRNDPGRDTSEGTSDVAARQEGAASRSTRRRIDHVRGEMASRRADVKERTAGRDEQPAAAADTGDVKAEEPGLFEGIPVGGLVLALALSAGIGAAGGLIYAGIMGYNRS